MKINPILHAVVTEFGSNRTEVISRNYYSTKKEMKAEMKANGYSTKFIFSDADYEKVMNKIKKVGLFALTANEIFIYETVNDFGSLEELTEESSEGAVSYE